VKRLEYNAKMVEIERKQEAPYHLKLSLKGKEEQVRALVKAVTRLQALLHGPELKQSTFSTENERVEALLSDCTAEASDIRGRELLALEEERKEMRGQVVQSAAEVMKDARRMKESLETALAAEKQSAQTAAEAHANILAATQDEASNRIAQLTAALKECGAQLETTREREDTAEHQLLCYRKIAHRLVQYLSDKRKLLHNGGDGTQPYSPTELSDYAKYLGIEPTSASEVYARWWFFALDSAARAGTYLTWIAEEALTAPLPPHWSSHRDDTGDVYFVRPPPLPSPCCSRYWIHRTSERSAVQIGQS
jgi:hypothetical protein